MRVGDKGALIAITGMCLCMKYPRHMFSIVCLTALAALLYAVYAGKDEGL
ncbi:MAG: hypothetical protein RL684_1961 [Pseudomonadota bacterium]|jgi:hypothetical protein